MDAIPDATDEDTATMPHYLRTFHLWMEKQGKKESTAKAYVRQLALLFEDDGKSPTGMAYQEYFNTTKASLKNKMGNGQRSAAIKLYREWWDVHKGGPLEDAGNVKLYQVKGKGIHQAKIETQVGPVPESVDEQQLRKELDLPKCGWQVKVVKRLSRENDVISIVSPGGSTYTSREVVRRRLGRADEKAACTEAKPVFRTSCDMVAQSDVINTSVEQAATVKPMSGETAASRTAMGDAVSAPSPSQPCVSKTHQQTTSDTCGSKEPVEDTCGSKEPVEQARPASHCNRRARWISLEPCKEGPAVTSEAATEITGNISPTSIVAAQEEQPTSHSNAEFVHTGTSLLKLAKCMVPLAQAMQHVNGGDASQAILCSGRDPTSSLAQRIHGLYLREEGNHENKVVFVKAGQEVPTIIFYSEAKSVWRITNRIGAKGDFARVKDSAAVPWEVKLPWRVFCGEGYQEDLAMHITLLDPASLPDVEVEILMPSENKYKKTSEIEQNNGADRTGEQNIFSAASTGDGRRSITLSEALHHFNPDRREAVLVDGRRAWEKNAQRMNGLYLRDGDISDPQKFWTRVGHDRVTIVSFDPDNCRWKISKELGTKGDYAHVRDKASLPWEINNRWKVYNGDSYKEDCNLRVRLVDPTNPPPDVEVQVSSTLSSVAGPGSIKKLKRPPKRPREADSDKTGEDWKLKHAKRLASLVKAREAKAARRAAARCQNVDNIAPEEQHGLDGANLDATDSSSSSSSSSNISSSSSSGGEEEQDPSPNKPEIGEVVQHPHSYWPPKQPLGQLGHVAAKMSVRTGLRCWCCYARVCLVPKG